MNHTRYRYQYRLHWRFSKWEHSFELVGSRGGGHLHLSENTPEFCQTYGTTRYSGGIEAHYRTAPDYMADTPPSHDECWLIKANCWHDGSSLQVTEEFGPMFERRPTDYAGMFDALTAWADSNFYAEEEPK
jgi:hypothetical protein